MGPYGNGGGGMPVNSLMEPFPSSGGQDETYAAYRQAQQQEAENERIRQYMAMVIGASSYMGARPAGMMRGAAAGLGSAAAGYGAMALGGHVARMHGIGGPSAVDLSQMYGDAAGIPRVPTNR
jgi:hypothetical protein